MKSLRVIPLFLLLILSVACQTTAPVRTLASQFHIAHNVQQFVTWETKANAVSERSNEVIRLEHYEIPLRLLATDFEDSLDKNIRDSLIFKKNNELYVRWPINPEDTKWHLEVKSFLEKNKVDSEPKKFFDAYLTASRSMILVNPENGASFSLKVSTNLTGGQWKDKKQTWKDARQVRRMNKYVSAVIPQMKTESLVIMDEPLAMGIEAIDHGLIVRSLNDLPEDNHYYLPAFSALHEIEGARIAKLNGATDPVAYWEKHLIQPLANAMAEYFTATGAWYDSPHGQNFLVELDREMKPTGRIVLRDLGDSYLLEDFVKNTKFAWIMKDWENNKVVTKAFPTGIGLLKGNHPPKWLTAFESKEYSWSFYRHFEKRFAELSGVPAAELLKTDSKDILFDYTSKKYPVNDKWKKFTDFAGCFNGEPVSLKGEPCPEFITKRQVRIDCKKAVNAIINP